MKACCRSALITTLLAGLAWPLAAPAQDVIAVEEIASLPGAGTHSVLATADGGLLLLGTARGADDSRDMAIWKLRRDLKPDPAFGEGGVVVIGGSGDDQAADAVELPARKGGGFLVIGQAGAGDGDFAGLGHAGKMDLAFIRLTPEGTLEGDNAIRLLGGSEDDEFIVHLNNFSEPGNRILASGDGYIVAAQTRSRDGDFPAEGTIGVAESRDALVLKIDAAGRLDRAFGQGGFSRFGTSALPDPEERSPNDFLFSLAPQPDGGVVASGYVLGRDLPQPGGAVPTRGNLARDRSLPCEGGIYCYLMEGLLLRFDPSGRLVGDWGDRGVRFIGGSHQEKQYDVIRDSAGRHVFVGRTSSFDRDLVRQRAVRKFDGYIGRLTAEGDLDPSFGESGIVAIGGTEQDKALLVVEYRPGAYAVALEAGSSEITLAPGLAANGHEGAALIVFLDSDGAIASYVAVDTDGLDRPTGMALTDDGRLVVSGVSLREDAQDDADQKLFVALASVPVGD